MSPRAGIASSAVTFDHTHPATVCCRRVDPMWHRVGSRADIIARKVRRVRVGYYWVALHVWKETIYAIEDECPHRGATLANGGITEDGFVACPEHGWEFNLITGVGREDWEGCVVRFELEERDGDVFAAEKPPPRFPLPRMP